ncbi:L-histidine N(alpha)-methyltransferase [Flavobacterium sp.]
MKDTAFYKDVLNGLQAPQKYLPSKYFYDAKGDILFQKIMEAPEYYVTNSDMEIFSNQSSQLVEAFGNYYENFDVIELGAGDAVKSTFFLKALANSGKSYTYRPIDISINIIDFLHSELPQRVAGISINGLVGEYLPALKQAYLQSSNKKLVLFLGSSIGNFEIDEAKKFLREVCNLMNPGDSILIGFDLKKNPRQILAAYNDAGGITKAFNLNLLSRINKELGADIDLDSFEHFPTYDPVTGSCRSYLISKKKQVIFITGAPKISLSQHEPIHMELSKKFSVHEIDEIATELGFQIRPYFFDKKSWYCNAIWEKK